MLNRLADYMAQRTTATVAALASTGIHVVFADPRAEFADHGACDAVEYVHKFVLGPEGGGDNPIVDDDNPNCMGMPGTAVLCISRASFHPNTNGTDAYARVLRTALINAGYSGV